MLLLPFLVDRLIPILMPEKGKEFTKGTVSIDFIRFARLWHKRDR
jgi:hypothetical protein